MSEKPMTPDYIFEVSWEVCNLVGGIYTVLSTRANTLQTQLKDKNIYIGPDVWRDEPSPYFVEDPQLLKGWYNYAVNHEYLKIRVGRWNIPGKPIAILVNFDDAYLSRNEVYTSMWEWYGVESLHAYGDYDESCMFAISAAQVIESFYNYHHGEKMHYVAHFDEWTTGMGLLYIRHHLPAIATLFTTHATSIGRSISGNNKPLYDCLPFYNGDQMARELNMEAKHSLEKTAARVADCFTTVSDITALECTRLLDKKPDVVTPNGFEQGFVPKTSQYVEMRAQARGKLAQVAQALVGYTPAEDAFYIATSGRYEYKNKGINLFIETLKRIKEKEMTTREIIAYILVPGWVDQPRAELLKRIVSPTKSHKSLEEPIVTHTLHNAHQDMVLNHLRAAGITNHPKDNVKVIFVPSYLKGSDGIFDMPYYHLLMGFDATAFPSYYEPWGYTPLESIGFGIPTITTDLSGFGQWVKSIGADGIATSGVEVLHRSDNNFDALVNDMACSIVSLSNLTDKQREEASTAAKKTAKQAAWSNFILYYNQAYDVALHAARARMNK